MSRWSLESWKQYILHQPPGWIQDIHLQRTLDTLRNKPPLVFKEEIQLLKKRLSKVHDGEYFIVQGGDCAETFSDFNTELIKNKLNILLQMSVLLSYKTSISIFFSPNFSIAVRLTIWTSFEKIFVKPRFGILLIRGI